MKVTICFDDVKVIVPCAKTPGSSAADATLRVIDVIESDGGLVAYVADISGHGLPAGQLMGMLKTAMRLAVQFRQMPVAALESVDRVLPDLKKPEMYATLALLRFDGSSEAEYALAGHPPILLVHGEADPVVPALESHKAAASLRASGQSVQTLFAPGLGHGIDDAGLAAGSLALQKAFMTVG